MARLSCHDLPTGDGLVLVALARMESPATFLWCIAVAAFLLRFTSAPGRQVTVNSAGDEVITVRAAAPGAESVTDDVRPDVVSMSGEVPP